MNVYSHDGIVGVAFSGWLGVLLLIYIIIEFALFSLTRMTLLSKLYYYIRLKGHIRENFPRWWDVKIMFLLIRKTEQLSPTTGNRVIDIPISLKHRSGVTDLPIDFHNHNQFTDYISVMDNIFNYRTVLIRIKDYDSINKVDVRKYKRNSILEEMGIK